MRKLPTARTTPQTEAIARSFYAMLTAEGFDKEQVIGLAAELIELVGRDLQPVPQAK